MFTIFLLGRVLERIEKKQDRILRELDENRCAWEKGLEELRRMIMATKEELIAEVGTVRAAFDDLTAQVAVIGTEVGETGAAVGALKTRIEELIAAGSIPDEVITSLRGIAEDAGTLSGVLAGDSARLDALQEHPIPPPVEEPPVEG